MNRMTAGQALALFLTGLCLTVQQSAQAQTRSADDYYNMIIEYVGKIENIYNGNWAYTYTVDDRLDEESRTIRRDNSQPFLQREALLAINGMPPSQERLQEHIEDRERALRRRQERQERQEREQSTARQDRPDRVRDDRDEKERFLDMLVKDSIHFIRQENELLYLGFSAMEDEREKIFENIEGTLIIDTEQEYIKELRVNVIEPFSPFFLGHIEDGYFSLRFELNDGIPMQSEITWQLDGQAFFFRDLDADQEVVWSDIERI